MAQALDVDGQRMDELTAGLPTKSAKIRRLAAAGYERADIARYLGIRYQFVYNVLSAPQPQANERANGLVTGATEPAMSSKQEQSQASPQWVWTTIRKGGSVELPVAFLEALGIGEGDQVQLALKGGAVRISSREAALREVQELVRTRVPEGVSLVDELIAERRAEAATEDLVETDD
jgi:antitoxin component of MazEF toxin-antitoxin module